MVRNQKNVMAAGLIFLSAGLMAVCFFHTVIVCHWYRARSHGPGFGSILAMVRSG
jgi:hypothetical protein